MSYQVIEKADEIILEIQIAEVYERLEERTEHSFKNLFSELAEKGKNVTLDFKNVEVVDSLFIGQLIILHKKLKEQGKQLKIENLNDMLKDLFERLRLDYLGLKI